MGSRKLTISNSGSKFMLKTLNQWNGIFISRNPKSSRAPPRALTENRCGFERKFHMPKITSEQFAGIGSPL